jgi:PilZ domain
MSPLELLAPETAEAIPFSVRLAARRLAARAQTTRSERRAHERRSAADLEWLQAVRLTGSTGYDVRLVDLSEGGALLEVNEPLRPGVMLTLELTGPGLETTVPLEVLRCYIANLRGETATYRGACAFAHLIELPGKNARPVPVAATANFVGTDAALKYLLDRCTRTGATGITLERNEVLHVLDALHARTAARTSDSLSRHSADLLAAILPPLRVGASREVVMAALEARLLGLPAHWRSRLQPTCGRLTSLIDHCASAPWAAAAAMVAPPSVELPPIVDFSPAPETPAPEVAAPKLKAPVDSAFQKIVVRHADGKILKGYTQDFHPSRPQFSLWPSINATPKERTVVPVRQLKAVFFVRDFNGDPKYQERKSFAVRGQGRRVEVTFTDAETILGTTLSYRPDSQGFFVSPADPSGNNIRIYVVSKAVRRVRFL